MKSNAERQREHRGNLVRYVTAIHRMILEMKEEMAMLRNEMANRYVTAPSLDKKTPPHLPKELIPLSPPIVPPKGAWFDSWWEAYPHKVGKGAARTAFAKALTKTSLDQLGAGLERYKAIKPQDRPWCNPATWLNQERWNDVPAANGQIICSALRVPSSKCGWPACSCSVLSQCQAVNGELHV